MSDAAQHRLLVRKAEEWLALNGFFAWPNQTGAAEIDGRFIRFGKRGSADILCVLDPDGRHAEFEAKTGKATQRKVQKVHQRMVEKRGGLYLVFRSIEELAERLTAEGYPPKSPESQNGQSVSSQASQPAA